MTQPLDDKTRVEREAEEYYQSSTTHLTTYHRSGYISGATKERERAQELIEALEKILKLIPFTANPEVYPEYCAAIDLAKQALANYTKDAGDHSE